MYQSTLKMNKTDYLQDISEIRSLMERSSRFISLSGLSGIMAGIYALAASFLAYKVIYPDGLPSYEPTVLSDAKIQLLLLNGIVTLVLAVTTGILLTLRRTKKMGLKFWDHPSKRLLINLSIPLLAGGLFSLILLNSGFLSLVPSVTLLFYGMALLNASNYTLSDIRYLGISEIVLGLFASYFIGYGLLFWAIGFGVLHIIYGTKMYYKYEK